MSIQLAVSRPTTKLHEKAQENSFISIINIIRIIISNYSREMHGCEYIHIHMCIPLQLYSHIHKSFQPSPIGPNSSCPLANLFYNTSVIISMVINNICTIYESQYFSSIHSYRSSCIRDFTNASKVLR